MGQVKQVKVRLRWQVMQEVMKRPPPYIEGELRYIWVYRGLYIEVIDRGRYIEVGDT